MQDESTKQETSTGYTIKFEDYLKLSKKEKSYFGLEFCYQSNLIEGITDYYIGTLTAGEKPAPKPKLFDHYSAFEYMLKNFKNNPEEEDVKDMHHILMQNILENPKDAGKYRKCKIWVGGKGKLNYNLIPKFMESLEYDILNLNQNGRIDYQSILNIHHKFETIHPFVDGNGRTGRLLLNWLSLKHFKKFNVITAEKRSQYYQDIRNYEANFRKNNLNAKFSRNRKIEPHYDLETLVLMELLQKSQEKSIKDKY